MNEVERLFNQAYQYDLLAGRAADPVNAAAIRALANALLLLADRRLDVLTKQAYGTPHRGVSAYC